MAKQVIKLGLEFDTKAAIASYRDLISEMSKGGADPKAIRQFTAAIEKAETELAQLAAEGSTGFTDSKGIEQYQKKVLKTVTSMQQLALRMQEFSKSGDNFPTSEVKKLEAEIEKLKKQITDAQKAAKEGLVKSLTNNGGFTKKEAEAIAETVKTQNELIAKLEEEKRLRDEIRKAAEEPAKKAKASIQDKAIAKTTSGSEVVMEAVGMKGKKGVKEAREAVAAAIQQGIRDGWSAEDVKKKAIESLQASNLSDTVKKNIIQGLEAGFDTDTVRKYLDAVDKKVAANPAVKKYNAANESYGKVANGSLENYSQFITNSEAAAKAQQELANAQSKVNQTAADSAASQKKMSDTAGQMAGKAEQAADGFIQMSDAQKNSVKSTEQLEGGFNRLADRLKYMFGFTAMFNRLRQIIRSTFNDIQELDKAYASIAYVTNETVGDLWSTYGEYAGMAEKLGQSTADVVKASAIYRQQGLDTAKALELTTDTMKLATIAGNDYSTATQEMTAALRGFKMEMDEGSHVSDVYSELAAHAAASVDDIAQAMSRTASIANSAGMSFENTSAFLTQMIETTQESAENIGTSMKTIIARFTELKENVAGTADSEFEDLSFNKVDEALKSVGVALKDTTGQFRNLDEVFLELSGKWASLDRNTQRYIATVAAGSRQQSRFIALMDNYDRTVELIETAADSEGKADEQFAKAADTIEFKLNAIKTRWEEFKLSIMDSSFVKGLLDTVNSVMDRLKNVKMPQIAIFSTFAILAAKTFILNFINTLKNTAKNFQQIGRVIGDKIGKAIHKNSSKFKINLQLDVLKSEEQKLKNKLIETVEANKKYSQVKFAVNLDTSNAKTAFDTLTEHFKSQGMSETDATAAAIQNVSQALGIEAENANQAVEALKNHNQQMQDGEIQAQEYERQLEVNQQQQQKLNLQQQKNQAIGQALTQTFHSLIASLSMMAAGTMKSSEAAKTFGTTSATAIGNIATSLTVATISTQGLSAGFKALGAAVWSALWPVLAVAAAIGAVAAIWYVIAKNNERAKDAVDVNKQLQLSTEKLNSAREKLNDTETELNDLKETKKNVDDITKEYETLHKQKIKTAEETEREKELAEEIKEKYPEIVTQINAENNTIEISNSLLDDKLEKLDEQIKKEKELQQLQSIEVRQAEQDVAYYENVNKLQGYFGSTLKMGNSTMPGEFTVEDILKGGSHIDARNTVSSSLEFAKNIGLGTFYSISEMSEEDEEKLNAALNYAFGDNTVGVNGFGFTSEQIEAIEDIRNTIIEIRKDNLQYADQFNSAKESMDLIYEEMPEWEKQVRAGYIAVQREGWKSGEQLKQEGVFSRDKSVGDNFGAAEQQLGIDLENGTINGQKMSSDLKATISGISLSYQELYRTVQSGINVDDDYNDILASLSGTAKEQFISWFPTEKDYQKYTDEGSMAEGDFLVGATQKYYEAVARTLIQKQAGIEQVDSSTVSKMAQVQRIIGDGNTASLDETITKVDNLWNEIEKYSDNPEYQETLRNLIPKEYWLDNLEQIRTNISTIFNSLPENISVDTAQVLNSAWEKYAEEGKIGGKNYLNSVLELLKENKIPEEQWSEWFNLDFTKITNQEDFDKFKEEQIKRLREAGYENAEELFNTMQEYAKKNGILNISIETDADYDKFMDSLDAAEEKVQELGDSIISITKEMKQSGEIGYSTFEKLKKTLEGLDGLDVYDYVNIDESGKITANEKQLKELYEAQIKAKKEKLDQAIEEEKLQIDTLKNQKTALELQLANAKEGKDIVLNYQDMNNSLIPQVENWAKIVDLMYQAAHNGQKMDMSAYKPTQSTRIEVNDQNREAVIKQLENQIAGVDAQIKLRQKTINKLEIDSKHVAQETQAQFREWQMNMAEASAATDDLTKKQEGLAKAQKDVTDKQKALNEAIADYNKLLYGSENRQSGLDLLYNYKEAISAFSDEMSRAQELIEDSKSVNDSVAALSRYTNAAHQRLAYMNAQNERYDAGLAARRNQLLSGATSYTNELTGNTTTINFGDYVKYNADTGLIALDQKLIQDAKIADEWKDYIEKQVDDYNKLSMESLKNQDEIRKLEKEIQKRREDAIKKYADFEKDVAETLKETYQKQVDDLKNRYDSMKEADDDYLDALQEAIEKQRKLRERENKWEDLAQKQKKLALMQRDTSGANTLENQRLQKEIEKDQEAMLDESIDSAIENMQKLAEKQDELRQTEIELKEALIENTMYWNQQAEGVVQGFETAEDYVEWFKNTAEGLNEQTAAQFENTMNEARNKFGEASEEIAWRIQDDMSQTGDAVAETIEVIGDEIKNIVASTSDTFVDEVSNTFERTRQSFNENMDSAIEKVHSAQTALQEAIDKLNETSAAARAASEEIARLAYERAQINSSPEPTTPQVGTMDLGGAGNNEAAAGITDQMNSLDTLGEKAQYMAQVHETYGDSIRSMVNTGDGYEGEVLREILDHGQISVSASGNGGLYNYLVANESLLKPFAKDWDKGVSSNIGYVSAKFEKGGLVNYTGPAWVDGTPDRPEAFLSSEDTERIGNAAKLLSDIPALTRSNVSTSNQTYGDTNIEINLNIDHISSDVDVDEMLERVKQEIVDVARPIGTNVILQQQV